MFDKQYILRPGDIYFTGSPPGKEGIVTKLIRRFTEEYREAPTEFTHVGMILAGGSPKNAITVEQTFPHVRISSFQDYENCHIRVYRLKGYQFEVAREMARKIRDRRGEKYGLLKLFAYAADATINRIISGLLKRRIDLKLFRKLDWTKRYFCSQVIAQAIEPYLVRYDGVSLLPFDPLEFSPDDLVDLFDSGTAEVDQVAEFNRPT